MEKSYNLTLKDYKIMTFNLSVGNHSAMQTLRGTTFCNNYYIVFDQNL